MAAGRFETAQTSRMENIKAISAFWNGGNAAWIVLTAMTLLGLAVHRKGQSITDWDLSALVLATVLVAPHIMIQDLDLVLIVVALAITHGQDQVSEGRRRALFLLMLSPAIYLGIRGQAGPTWPVIPAVLLGIFVCCVVQSARRVKYPQLSQV